MKWLKVKDKDRSAIRETPDGSYEILLNQQSTEPPKGYLLYDVERMALLNHQKEIVLGLGMFCAQGAPSECIFKTIKDIKDIF